MSMEERLLAFLKENPNDPMVLLSLGNIYYREGRLEEATQVLVRAIETDSSYMAAYPVLGECWEMLGELDKAREAYRKALEIAQRTGDRTMEREMSAKLESMQNEEEI